VSDPPHDLRVPARSFAPRPDIGDLYRRYGGLVFRRVRRFYGEQEAHDVTHEVFARAIEKLDGFRGESSPGTWLYQLTTRYCLNRLRDSRRRSELIAEHDPASWWSPSTAEGRQERDVLAHELWAELDEESALVAAYYWLDGFSHAEIAEMVGCSRRTIGNRLAEVEARLRRRLEAS
jgi:RNA polymerase sigma-70 factor (ECF subfamily)